MMHQVQVLDIEEFEERVYEQLEKALGENTVALLRDQYDEGWDD